MSKYHFYISLIPFIICTCWSIYFFYHYANAHISKKILFWFMLTASSLYFAHFIVFNRIYSLIPITDTIYTFATLSVYPIFYLYIVSLTNKINWKYSFVLLPGVIIALIIGLCYLTIPGQQMLDFLIYCHYEEGTLSTNGACILSLQAHKLMKFIILIEVILCLYGGFKKLKNFALKVNESYSNTEHKDLKEIKYLLSAFVVTSFLSVFADLMGRVYFIDSTLSMTLILTPFAIMLFLVGYIGNLQTFTIDDLITESQHNLSQSSQSINKIESQRIMKEQIDRIMIEEKLFLKPDLKVSDISSRLNSNRTYIYDALKLGSQEEFLSFPNYVNKFRINYCIELIKFRKETCVKNIMYEAGFVSEATFYRAFKKETGTTPKEYMKQLENN